MAGAALIAQGAGSGLSAFGSYREGLAQQSYYKYLAANARTQEGIVQQQADQESNSAQNEGAYQTGVAARRTRELEGAQATAEAANGTAGSVTGADIARDTFDKAKMDQLAIKYNADVVSWRAQNNAKLQKWNLENEAMGDEAAAKNAKTAGKLGAISTLLSGAGQVAGSYSNLNKNSPTDSPTALLFSKNGGRRRVPIAPAGSVNY